MILKFTLLKNSGKNLAVIFLAGLVSSCSLSKQISKQASQILLKDFAISSGHIGISIYEPATNTYWYNHDAAKYFVPASNTKLFTLYAGMKYLGDSLAGLRYEVDADSNLRLQPTGDPTFLHQEFTNQPVYNFLMRFKTIT
ncbi:MAG: D-alanyl-D-alanine carboxypeptidase, partial [Aquabacterium sp.]|nr:D-alanyl-D-alanine carboxypeptidase [Ferruginibacter sp.]